MARLITKRERLILYLTIGAVTFAVIFNLFIAPVLNKNDMLNKEINVAKARLNKYGRLLGQKTYLQSKYNKYSLSPAISGQQTDRLVGALSELENISKDANIRIIDIRPQSSKSSPILYKELVIDLKTEGTMEGYLKFIYDTQNSLSLLRIKRFLLNSKPNTQLLEGTFSISQLSGAE